MVSKAENSEAHGWLCHSPSRRAESFSVRVILEDLFGEEVLHLRLIVYHFQVSGLQQLRPAVAQLLPYRLLYSRIVEITLARRIARQQLVDRIAHRPLALPIQQRKNVRHLAGLQ